MTKNDQTRHRRSRLALGAGATGVLAIIAALRFAVERPAPRIDLERATPTGPVPMARSAEQPWGHDTLRGHDSAKPKAPPAVGPGLPASVAVLATQRPFVAMPAMASPPTVPEAYRGAIPPPAQRTRQ